MPVTIITVLSIIGICSACFVIGVFAGMVIITQTANQMLKTESNEKANHNINSM